MYRPQRPISHFIMSPMVMDYINALATSVIEPYHDCMRKRECKISNYRPDTKTIRESDWRIASIPYDLQFRHVEITGPANNKKMMLNACNSGANGYMIDLEDSMSPTPQNVIDAHSNLHDLFRNNLSFEKYNTEGHLEKIYRLPNVLPTLMVRHRGLHMRENLMIDSNNRGIPAPIFDIGLHLFHNGKLLEEQQKGIYFYTPKLENYEDAIFMNELFTEGLKLLNISPTQLKTTVLIETYPAIYQTHEIVHALKDYIVGLNCGRWDYLYSMLKKTDIFLPHKTDLHMQQPFMESYVRQIVKTCQQRNLYPMGGMSAVLPSKDKNENKVNLQKIQTDKQLEIQRGCRGAWVAHPDLVEPIQKMFSEHSSGTVSQGTSIPISKSELEKIYFTRLPDTRENIRIALIYISSWLYGVGAVAIDNVMEDLATAEISIHQIRKVLQKDLMTKQELDSMTQDVFQSLTKLHKNTLSVFSSYVLNDSHLFLTNVHSLSTPVDDSLGRTISFPVDKVRRLLGSRGHKTGIDLTTIRGEYLNQYLAEGNTYKFLGTSNGISAVNVVAGGNGMVGPYAGGWQTNAMKNRLGMLLPDTLHVSPEEAAVCAQEMNHHLNQADCVQHLQGKKAVDYHKMALLADMEQGWNTPEKIRMSVKLAIQNGINVIHIEDQGEKKRCGHLGDKELNTIEDYCLILRAANLAAQELLGNGQNIVTFVARTDAYSAKRIVNSSLLESNDHSEHDFIDWDRGTSADGKYLYLKEGVNPKTGNTYGMDISIQRASRVIEEGLATHVWMETPDADLQVARDFLIGVNKNVETIGKKAHGLYNHSPSFDWDLKFFREAEKMTADLLDCLEKSSTFEREVNRFFQEKGKNLFADDTISKDRIADIIVHVHDYFHGEERWNEIRNEIGRQYLPISSMSSFVKTYAENQVFQPKEEITKIIVNHRLETFSKQLSSFGYNLHLITLPEFHVTAYHMHQLSQDFSKIGINAFVKSVQRPERLLSEFDPTYTYYKHQTATGTGLEAAFSQIVGSSNVNALQDSTEQDDLKQRM